MTWSGAALSQDQADLVDLVGAVIGKHGDAPVGDDPGEAARARESLAEAGLWTLGVPESQGGGGAPLALRQTALCALGRRWTAWAWACAQAHAAAEILVCDTGGLLSRIHAGEPVAVVDTAVPGVELEAADGYIRGRVWRLDPAGDDPHVVVLVDDSTAWILPPDTVRRVRQLRRTGMAGALTVTADVAAAVDGGVIVTGAPVDEVRARLRLGGAAIAAGIAIEAAERSLEYSRTRIQFAAPLTELPTVRASLFDQAGQATDALALALGAEPSPLRAAAVLAGNCERAIATATAAVQSHGGYGYLAEYGIERLLRDAVSLRAATGALAGARSGAAVLTGPSDSKAMRKLP
ncbi:acyl-CoA dehydrogenase family protein [Nocardia sp. R6R-6]|uniref:acyl-CoA dehydrogenase family protein n=1 Tax=Nocardia sp. R6R-6 TaxID=3459303 RepID=UPI00403DABD4